jgi:peptidoglycan/xylan/chitin deacetylase (PgdA/CDA1 family)
MASYAERVQIQVASLIGAAILSGDAAEAKYVVRRLVKQTIELAMSSPPVAWMTQHRVRGKRLILAYHGIIPEGQAPAGERTLFVTQRDFASQLDMLAAEVDVVALDRIDDQGDGRPRVAITIDDAYRGAVNVGVRELAARSLPATIFVAPGRLNNHVFWWDALAHENAKLDEKIRRHALDDLKGDDERVRAWAEHAQIPSRDTLPDYAQTATRAELAAALRFPGITLGSHSWSHRNLASLEIDEIATEVRGSHEWLRGEFGDKVIDWFAYPYGLESPQARVAVAEAGYAGALRIDGGWHRPTDVSPFARPRFSVGAGHSLAGIRVRLRGAALS